VFYFVSLPNLCSPRCRSLLVIVGVSMRVGVTSSNGDTHVCIEGVHVEITKEVLTEVSNVHLFTSSKAIDQLWRELGSTSLGF
jgi:hypothetical protein